MLYRFGKGLSYLICKAFGRLQVIGRCNIPISGGVLICSNHISFIDPPALGAACPRPVHFMAKTELFKIPILGSIIAKVGAFPVRRGTPDRAALRNAIGLLHTGEVVGMFPEGKRSISGDLQPAEGGVGLIVLQATVPVIPVALIGTNRLLPDGAHFVKFSRAKVVFGSAVSLDDLYEQGGREAMDEASKRIMQAIAELQKLHGQ